MDLIDQLKTPQGYVAVCGANRARDGSPWLEFAPANPLDNAAVPDGGPRPSDATIEDLAFIDRGGLLDLAAKTGPLFGASTRESLVDWQSAANVARAVVVIQEVVNGAKPLAVLTADDEVEPLVAKTQVANMKTGIDFSIYAISFAVDTSVADGYVACMPDMPWLKKFVGGGFDYVVADVEHVDEGLDYLAVTLLSFKKEISLRDFAAVLACYYDEARVAVLLSQARKISMGFADGEGDIDASSTTRGALRAHESSLSQSDIAQLRRLVQAIISLHLEGVRLDLFRSNEDDDFLSFDTYLAYMWFRFSKKLGQVKIGYCPQCGKAFSLAGRRGVPKKYCSEACKTAAKNEKTRQLQVDVRQAFVGGQSIEGIARSYFPKQARSVACGKIRHMLATWVDLKHRVDDDIAQGDGELAKRCVEEGVFTEMQIARRVKAARRRR